MGNQSLLSIILRRYLPVPHIPTHAVTGLVRWSQGIQLFPNMVLLVTSTLVTVMVTSMLLNFEEIMRTIRMTMKMVVL